MRKILLTLSLILAVFCCKAEEYADLIYGRTSYAYQNIHLSESGDIAYSLFDNNGMGLNGFELEQVVGFPLSTTLPMDLETGLNFQAAWGKKTYEWGNYDEKCSVNLYRLGIPLNYIYHFNASEMVKISPYVGLDFRFNLASRGRYTIYQNDNVLDKEKINYFSKDDMEGHTFNRFQLGWHVGLMLEIKHFNIFAKYGTDFTKLYSNKETGNKISTANLSVGFGLCY